MSTAPPSVDLSHMLWGLDALVQQWIREDIPSFDYGGAVVGAPERTASLFAKSHVRFLALASCVHDATHVFTVCAGWRALL